jgi:hypothetical protein
LNEVLQLAAADFIRSPPFFMSGGSGEAIMFGRMTAHGSTGYYLN